MSEKTLHISHDVRLPLSFITQTQAILARKRVGKSYTASVQAEEMLRLGQQVIVIDYTGAWWGLRAGADGKPDGGMPIHVFGGDHADIPLEVTAGEVIAEAAVKERFSAILDLSRFRKAEALRFLAPFFETLYRLNRQAMHLFCDEADAYAPQRTFGGDDARTLGAMNDIVLRGGIRGIGCTLITQRSARINKDVLSQCGILTCLRISSPKDIVPVKEWVEVHDDAKHADEMIKSLPTLPIGTAWMWAPGWPEDPGLFQKVAIRKRTTFDSGATPKPGQKIRAPKTLRKLDREKLGTQIRETVDRVKANDPKELRKALSEKDRALAERDRTIATLEARPAATKERVKTVEKRVITDAQVASLEKLYEKECRRWTGILDQIKKLGAELAGEKIWLEIEARKKALGTLLSQARAVNVELFPHSTHDPISTTRGQNPGGNAGVAGTPVKSAPTSGHTTKPTQSLGRVAPGAGEAGAVGGRTVEVGPVDVEFVIKGPHQKILDAYAWWHSIGVDRPPRENVAPVAGYGHVRSRGFTDPLYNLQAAGYVKNDALTEAGRSAANWPSRTTTLAEYHEKLKAILPGPARKIFDAIHAAGGNSTREALAAACGYEHVRSRGFTDPLYTISARGFVDLKKGGEVEATALMYPEGLR